MNIVKQSSLQQMLFTDKGFEITQNEKELEQRIEFAKTLFDLRFSEKDFLGWKFVLFNNKGYNQMLAALGFDNLRIGSLDKGYEEKFGSFRAYFYKPSEDDFYTIKYVKDKNSVVGYRGVKVKDRSLSKWPYRISLDSKLCDSWLYFKTEEDKHYFEKELYPKHRKALKGYKEMYCENCGNFIFLTQPIQYYYNNNKKEQFYFKLGYVEENGIIKRLWVEKVVFFVDNLKITLYKEEVLKEDNLEAVNGQIFTVQYTDVVIKVKKEKVE